MTPLTKWLAARPPATIERLAKINRAASSSAHIILTLSYGLQDPHIRAINKMIVALLMGRHRAQRRGLASAEQRIEAKLQDLHAAINFVTGTVAGGNHTLMAKNKASNACKRVAPI